MFLNKNKQSVGFDAHIKLNRNIRTIGTVASVLLSVFVFLSAFPIAEPYDASAAIIPSATTLEITSTSNTLALDLDVNNASGNYSEHCLGCSAGVAFSVATDNITGYTLTLDTIDHSGRLINNRIPTASISSITSTYSRTYNFPVGTWGIQVKNGTTLGNFQPAPAANPVTIDTTDSPNSEAKNYRIGIGVKANYNTPAGTYSNTLVLQATGRPVLYEINYLDNTDDENVDNLPVQEASGVTPVASFTLSDEVPTRSGYEFVGWCDGEVDHTANPTTCTGTTYNPGDTYTFSGISSESTNIANLYAMWHTDGYVITFNTVNAESITFNGVTYTNGQTATVAEGTYSLVGNYATRYAFSSWNATAGTISNASYVDYNLNTYTVTGNATITLTGQYVETAVQGLASSSCTTTPMPTYDTRDNQVYWVKRLEDGNCWIMDNMNLGATDITTDLTSFNTNIGGTVSAATFNTWRKSTSTSAYTSPEFIPLAPENSAIGTDIDEYSGTKFGTLYNYCAATAGTYCYDEYSGATDATEDLCPAGWRMPKGGETTDPNNEFNAIYSNANYSNLNIAYPISAGGAAFTMAGTFYSSAPASQGRYSTGDYGGGYYWSSTRKDYNAVYMLMLGDSAYVFHGSPNFSLGRSQSSGGSLRCIRDTSMQNFSSADAAAMAEGATTTLTDRRDGKTYNVAKINGDVWMTQNLRFTGTDLKAVDSNVATDSTISYSQLDDAICSDSEVASLSVTTPCIKEGTDDNGDPTVWYNYAAASAGSIVEEKNNLEAVNSLCPKGWRLPTSAEQQGIANDTYKALYSPVADGAYIGGTLLPTFNGSAWWWSSTAFNDYSRKFMHFGSDNGELTAIGKYYRYFGLNVRCIKGDRTINEVSYMQDVNEKVKQATPKGASVTLTDRRDGEQYLVAKLEDNNIYMLDNLRLDPTAVDLDKLQGNTNAPDAALAYYKNGGGTAPSPANAVSSTWVASDPTNPYVITSHKDEVPSTTYGSGSNKTGVYYNHCAASAGTDCQTSTSTLTYDICPSGWRLPVITTGSWSSPDIVNNEMHTLYLAYGSNGNAVRDALSATYTGYISSSGDGSAYDVGSNGRYWAANGYWRVNSYGDFNDTYAAPAGNGLVIRCRAK